MNNFLNEIKTLDYWFNPSPEPIHGDPKRYLIIKATVFAIAAILIAIKFYPEKWSAFRPTLKKISAFCVTNVIIVIYWLFVNAQIIPILRARIWYPIWVIIDLLWIFFIFRAARKRRERRAESAVTLENKKYIP